MCAFEMKACIYPSDTLNHPHHHVNWISPTEFLLPSAKCDDAWRANYGSSYSSATEQKILVFQITREKTKSLGFVSF